MVEAAALPETFMTVWHNVFQRGALKSGETILIHGGSSGIGTTAIMLAKAFGAKVIVTAGSPQKCEACKKLGADFAIDYKTQDFVAATKEATGGRGADLILDMVGGDYVERNHDAAAVEGRIVQIATQQGFKVAINLLKIMQKRLTHTGSTLRPRPVADKAMIARDLEEKAWPLAVGGQDQAGDRFHLSVAGGLEGACTHGVERPCRQNRARSRRLTLPCRCRKLPLRIVLPDLGRAAFGDLRLHCSRLVACFVLAVVLAGAGHAWAVEAVAVRPGTPAVDLLPAAERYETDSDRLQVSTAPGTDGIVRRIEVRSASGKAATDWAVLALSNNTDEQLDRLIVAPHYQMAGSGLFWPDLGSVRIASVTPSQGFRPERQASNDADIYLITLDPGTTVTLVIELAASNIPQLYLWEPEAYKGKINSFTLYNGIVIGVSGLLALFLTILFVVKGSIMFPAAAALAWAVLGYIGIDFGFWNKVFALSPGDRAILARGRRGDPRRDA